MIEKFSTLLILFSLFFSNNVYCETTIIFRFDDFGLYGNEISDSVCDLFKKFNTKICLGVVPFRISDGEDTLTIDNQQIEYLRKGIKENIFEPALHGFAHYNNTSSNYRKSEFYSLPIKIQYYLINKADNYLSNKIGYKIEVFIPPWNSFDINTIKVLEKKDFKLLSSSLDSDSLFIYNGSILFLPHTCTINKFIKMFGDINFKQDNLIVVLFHPYDFKEYGDKRGKLHLSDLEYLLRAIKLEDYINVSNFKSVIHSDVDLSYNRYKHNYIFRNKFLFSKLINYKEIDYCSTDEIEKIFGFNKIVNCLLLISLAAILVYYLIRIKNK